MPQNKADKRPLHVFVSIPNGFSGQGGIDRIMASFWRELQRQNREDVAVEFLVTRGPGHILFSPFYVAAFCLRMLVARLTGRLDVLHINLSSHGSTQRKLIIAGWSRLLGVPYLIHLHGSRYQTFWTDADTGLNRRIRILFEHAARVIVLGSVWQRFVSQRAPGAAQHITIIANATEVPVLPQAGGGDRVHILFLGRLGERKGVPQLIDALAQMQHLDTWRATIAGDGEIDAARAQAAALGLADRIRFPGWVGSSDVASLIASADILALPSFAENLPVSVIEGMAAGLAVVTTPVGAVEDIITDGLSGLLVPPGDVGALKDALVRLVENPELRISLGTTAKAVHRERLELAPFTEAIVDVWKSAARL